MAIDEIEQKGPQFGREGQLKLALALYAVSDYKAAAERFERAESLRSVNPVNAGKLAHAYLEIGSNDKSIKEFKNYLAANLSPLNRAWAQHGLGVAYYRAGRVDDARAEWAAVLKAQPNSAPALNGLAYADAKRGKNLKQALAMIDRAVKLEPNDVAHQETRGYVLFRLGELDEALRILRRVAPQLPNDLDAQRDLKEVEEAVAKAGKKTSS